MNLNLVSESIYILREMKAQFKNPAVMWSTGKDSTVVLDLIRKAFSKISFPVIHIDTGVKFREIYEFRDHLAKEWNFEDQLKIISSKFSSDIFLPKFRYVCCNTLKTLTLKHHLQMNDIDALIVSIRRDEHGIRGKERFMSPRDKDFKWNVVQEKEGGDSGLESLQDVEMSGWGLYESDFGEDCDHVRIHPLLNWTELDIWEYIRKFNIPWNPLYSMAYVSGAYGTTGKRYRSIGCRPCSNPVDGYASTVDEIIKELESMTDDERDGRLQDKELAMQRLRALGYF